MTAAKIGIIGYGAIGSAFFRYLKSHLSSDVIYSIYDPHKGFDIPPTHDVDMYFICVNVPNDFKNRQDLTSLKNAINSCDASKPIFIRSTVLPGTCDNLNCIAMPEFMTEGRCDIDMRYIPWIVGKTPNSHLIENIKPFDKKIVYLDNVQCEFLKYWHNIFLAMKNNITNLMFDIWTKFITQDVPQSLDQYNIHDLQKLAKFQDIAKQLPLSELINPCHLEVLHRGKRGFDGKCLPKDLSCFIRWLLDIGYEKPGPFLLCDTLNKELLNNGRFLYSKKSKKQAVC